MQFNRENIKIDDPFKWLEDKRAYVEETFGQAIDFAGRKLYADFSGLRVNIRASSVGDLREWGIGGGADTYFASSIDLFVNPMNPNFNTPELGLRLRNFAVHEAHHLVWIKRHGWHEDLAEDLLLEGMAARFELELGVDSSHALTKPYFLSQFDECMCLTRLEEQAIHIINDPDYDYTGVDHKDWFVGYKGLEEFPECGGHFLGLALATTLLEETGKTPITAMDISTADVVGWWQKRYAKGLRLNMPLCPSRQQITESMSLKVNNDRLVLE